MRLNKKTRKGERKAQLQIQEMAFVLVAIVLFFGLLLILFSMFQSAKIKELAEQTRREKTISSLESIANMPEFSCRESFCIDQEKVIGFLNLNEEERKKYEDIWKKARMALIKIKKIYPPQTNTQTQNECGSNMENYDNCNTFVIYKRNVNYEAYSTYMPICHYDRNKGKVCEIAKLIVGFEAVS